MMAQMLRKISTRITPRMFRFFMNCYPPFIGAGISILEINHNFTYVKVRMKLTWYNRNYVGTQFGGSLYAMTDPFFMLMLLRNLSKDYIVWDKAAYIDFIKPGLGEVLAEFRLDQKLVEQIKEKADCNPKYIFDLPVEIINKDNQLVAKVIKTLYVRKKSLKN